MFVHFILSTSFRSEIQSAWCSVSSYLVSLVIQLPLAQDVSHEYGNFLLNSNIPIWLQTFIFFNTRASFQFVRMFYTFTGCTYYITINTNTWTENTTNIPICFISIAKWQKSFIFRRHCIVLLHCVSAVLLSFSPIIYKHHTSWPREGGIIQVTQQTTRKDILNSWD